MNVILKFAISVLLGTISLGSMENPFFSPIEEGTYEPIKNSNKRFSIDEDMKLEKLVEKHGQNSWDIIANEMPNRSARQCRDRWKKYLDPKTVQVPFSNEEDETLQRLWCLYGAKWDTIHEIMPKRTASELKIRWMFLERHLSTHQ